MPTGILFLREREKGCLRYALFASNPTEQRRARVTLEPRFDRLIRVLPSDASNTLTGLPHFIPSPPPLVSRGGGRGQDPPSALGRPCVGMGSLPCQGHAAFGYEVFLSGPDTRKTS